MNTQVKTADGGTMILDTHTRAVAACFFEHLDHGQGGIVTSDVDADYILPLRSFAPGNDIFFESPYGGDCLDDETEESEAATHIWWRATVAEGTACASPKRLLPPAP